MSSQLVCVFKMSTSSANVCMNDTKIECCFIKTWSQIYWQNMMEALYIPRAWTFRTTKFHLVVKPWNEKMIQEDFAVHSQDHYFVLRPFIIKRLNECHFITIIYKMVAFYFNFDEVHARWGTCNFIMLRLDSFTGCCCRYSQIPLPVMYCKRQRSIAYP